MKPARSVLALVCLLALGASCLLAAETSNDKNKIESGSKVYIEPMDGFENYLMAAFEKKHVALSIVKDKSAADYVISGTSGHQKAGWAKIVFMGNIHSDDQASITLADAKSGDVLFAYAVDKKSTMHGEQTTAEACAKHLKNHMDGKE